MESVSFHFIQIIPILLLSANFYALMHFVRKEKEKVFLLHHVYLQFKYRNILKAFFKRIPCAYVNGIGNAEMVRKEKKKKKLGRRTVKYSFPKDFIGFFFSFFLQFWLIFIITAGEKKFPASLRTEWKRGKRKLHKNWRF